MLLLSEALEHRLEPDEAGVVLWIERESDVASARSILESWRHNPDDARFAGAEARAAAHARAGLADVVSPSPAPPRSFRPSVVSWAVVLVSVLFTALGVNSWSALPLALFDLPEPEGVRWLLIDEPVLTFEAGEPQVVFLDRVADGEVWRLLTPVFVHVGGIVHLLFNGGWMLEFGRQIEAKRGPFALAAMVLVFGIASNLAQYVVGWWLIDAEALAQGKPISFAAGPVYLGGPTAGGLSGVVYGLFGYLWAKATFAKFEGLGVSSSTVGVMVVWLLVCFTGTAGPVANIAHLSGLIVGVLWGAAGHRIRRPF